MSDEAMRKLEAYMNKAGGTVVATGPIGLLNSWGNPRERTFLDRFDIHAGYDQTRAKLTPEAFFSFRPTPVWPVNRPPDPLTNIAWKGQPIDEQTWMDIAVGQGRMAWSGVRCQTPNALAALRTKIQKFATGGGALTVELPEHWLWRTFRTGTTWYLHVLSNAIVAVEDDQLTNHFTRRKLVRALRYGTEGGQLSCWLAEETFSKAVLYSPDLESPREGRITSNGASFDLSGICRYFIVELRGCAANSSADDPAKSPKIAG